MSLVSVGIVKIMKTIVIKIVKSVKTAGSWLCIHVEVRILLLLLSCCVAVTEYICISLKFIQIFHHK
jgi:hypothetical protein